MRVNCVVEKGSDGLFAVYSEDHIGKSYFGGFGESVSEAKEDFLASIREAIEEESQAGNKVPRFEDIRVCYHYDVPSFFNYFDFINVSKFAAYAGINESKMRAYKSGVAYPGEKTTARILKAVKAIGNDLSAVML
ncbi:MAG: pilus assembly protein HicB [Bacteroidales bacterium]|nr:pilus assembly protein HicB [Bacteroidales bacterium]